MHEAWQFTECNYPEVQSIVLKKITSVHDSASPQVCFEFLAISPHNDVCFERKKPKNRLPFNISVNRINSLTQILWNFSELKLS